MRENCTSGSVAEEPGNRLPYAGCSLSTNLRKQILTILSLDHCKRAISDVATFGDNDVVPFDVDTKFVAEKADQLADAILDIGRSLERKSQKDCKSTLHGVQIFSERLLAPVGQSGFRITTKIHRSGIYI
jgi:hypothetical protein